MDKRLCKEILAVQRGKEGLEGGGEEVDRISSDERLRGRGIEISDIR